MRNIPKLVSTPEEKQTLIQFITDAIEAWPEDFLTLMYSSNEQRAEFWLKILKFFSLPRTPLHAQFRLKIIAPDRQKRIEKETERVEQLIRDNLSDARKDERTRDNDSMDMSYHIIKEIELVNWEKIVNIGIPYQSRMEKPTRMVTKFAFQVSVSDERNPALYEKIKLRYPQYVPE